MTKVGPPDDQGWTAGRPGSDTGMTKVGWWDDVGAGGCDRTDAQETAAELGGGWAWGERAGSEARKAYGRQGRAASAGRDARTTKVGQTSDGGMTKSGRRDDQRWTAG